ncbi:MAG: hypothetical protein RI973_1349 [Bacteroidota bacterium]|jgi:pyrroloquinoline quinone biosynthesis protein B
MSFLARILPLLLPCSLLLCGHTTETPAVKSTFLVVLGNLQDGGSPHAGCRRDCCRDFFENQAPDRKVVSLGVVDRAGKSTWLFEASPDLPEQMKLLRRMAGDSAAEVPDGIFLTHAHIGHYAGLMFLGKEAMDARGVAVYAMPRMKRYLEDNGPWSQLVDRNNISLREIQGGTTVVAGSLEVTPLLVPHRDEFSETVGYRIQGPEKSLLFIPDIDKWEKWDRDIVREIARVDYALLDATFYDAQELPGRKMEEIPHPFVVESMSRFDTLPAAERSKVHFIHLNHTNPALLPDSPASLEIQRRGYKVARFGDILAL